MNSEFKVVVRIEAPELVQALMGLAGLVRGVIPESGEIALQEKAEAAEVMEPQAKEAVAEVSKEVAGAGKQPALEDVRAVLSKLTKSGKKEAVGALFTNFGARKLTEVDPIHYGELLRLAGEIA